MLSWNPVFDSVLSNPLRILTGSTMEVNISHRCRQGILTTPDLADPHLFDYALNELLQLMRMVHILLLFLRIELLYGT